MLGGKVWEFISRSVLHMVFEARKGWVTKFSEITEEDIKREGDARAELSA